MYFPPGNSRWCALNCILVIMQVCIIWAYKPNRAETIGTMLAFMKPFALLYCSALLCKQRHTQAHTNTLTHPDSNTHIDACAHTKVQTFCWHSLPMGYNGWYLHSSLDKRLVPLARWIVAKWMGIYHKAKALCEKWGMSLFRCPLFHSLWLSVVCICLFFLGVASAALSRLGSRPFLQQMEKLFYYRSSPPHLRDFIILISPALIEASHGPLVVLLPGSLHL